MAPTADWVACSKRHHHLPVLKGGASTALHVLAAVALAVFCHSALVLTPAAAAGSPTPFPGAIPYTRPDCVFWPTTLEELQAAAARLKDPTFNCSHVHVWLVNDIVFGGNSNNNQVVYVRNRHQAHPVHFTVQPCGERVTLRADALYTGGAFEVDGPNTVLVLRNVRLIGFRAAAHPQQQSANACSGHARGLPAGNAVRVDGGATVLAKQVVFQGGQSLMGGAVDIVHGKGYFEDCNFSSNKAIALGTGSGTRCLGKGGAIAVGAGGNSTLLISDVNFTNNSAPDATSGRDVYVYEGSKLLTCPRQWPPLEYQYALEGPEAVVGTVTGVDARICSYYSFSPDWQDLPHGFSVTTHTFGGNDRELPAIMQVRATRTTWKVRYAELQYGSYCVSARGYQGSRDVTLISRNNTQYLHWQYALNRQNYKFYGALLTRPSVPTPETRIRGKVATALRICPYTSSDHGCRTVEYNVCSVRNCPN